MKTPPVQTALIVGAASGMGAATARTLSSRQIDLWLADRDLAGAQALARQIREEGGRAQARPVDIADSQAVGTLFGELQKEVPRLDLMVHSAGILGETAFIEAIDDPAWQTMLAINLSGVFYTCRACVARMKQQGSGRIILFSSVAGLTPTPGALAYSCAKAAVNMLAKTLAKEVADHNIRVNAIAPGYIRTGMLEGLPDGFDTYVERRTPLKRMGEAQEIADLVAFLASEGADFFTGQVLSPNGGYVI